MVIQITGVSKTYRNGVRALNHLSLHVPAGCIFGYLGPNGAGKTTTINLLAGLLRKDEGEIVVLDSVVLPESYVFRKFVGFVLDTPLYYEKLTVYEHLTFVGAMYDLPRNEAQKRARELINFFDLAGKKNDLIESYSSGMKKKVSLAAAIIHQPKLLILDEPLEGIDPISAKQIKDMLRQMVNKGTTVFMSSHNLDTVEKICDEVAIINKGKLVFQAKTEDIRKKIKNEVSHETYQSLEEIFIDVVSDNGEQKQPKKLSWL
jgi:ABC-2 type transport system ATP-binding protein